MYQKIQQQGLQTMPVGIEGFKISIVKNQDFKKGIQIGRIDMNAQQGQKKQHDSSTDPRLGSSVFNDPLCATCGLDGKNCKGHFGYIELQKPIYNPIFLDQLKQVLQLFCIKCSKFLFSEEEFLDMSNDIKKIITKAKTGARCRICGAIQPKVEIKLQQEQPQILLQYEEDSIQIFVENVRDFLQKINKKQFQTIFNVQYDPVDLIFSEYFPIPPPHVRTQLNQTIFNAGKTYQNHLTQLYQKLIRNLTQYQAQPQQIYSILNEIFGVASEKKQINKNSFKYKMDKKIGFIRQNIICKRVDNSFRTVAGNSIDISIDEVCVPKKILSNLSVPSEVTAENIDVLQELVNNGKKYPGANNVLSKGKKYPLIGYTKNTYKLEIGDIVYRHPLPGERCFINRQPSLHLYSINYCKILPNDCEVLQLNNAATSCLNMDFDGDEGNGAFLINQQNIEGAKILCSFDYRMTNLNDNTLVLEPNHDTPFGFYLFTKYYLDKQISRDHILYLLCKTQFEQILPYKDSYLGYEILEYILTKDLEKYYINKEPITNDTMLEMFLDYYYINGQVKTKIFIQNIQVFSFQVVTYHSKTITLYDAVSKYDFNKFKHDFIEMQRNIQKTVLNKFITNKVHGKYNIFEDSAELITRQVQQFISERDVHIYKSFSDQNGYMTCCRSGSKGGKSHVVHIQYIGIQLEGQKLFPRGDNNRYCPHHKQNIGLREANVVLDGLINGITSIADQTAINAFARLGFVIQKVKTAIPGYINRKLDQFLSSVNTSYQNTMLINNQFLLSMAFAGNNYDIKYQRRMKILILEKDNEYINQQFPGISSHIINDIRNIRDQCRYSFIYSQGKYKLNNNFCNPIDFELLLKQVSQQEKKQQNQQHLSPKEYENFLSILFNYIQVLNYNRNNRKHDFLHDLDQGYKQIFRLFVYDKLSYKCIIQNKITAKMSIELLKQIIQQYHRFRINPGELVGLQCAQAFSKDVTQKSIDAFHKTGAEKVDFHINWVDQLQKYLQNGEQIVPQYVVRFKKEYNKNEELFVQLKNYLIKKILKDYVVNYEYGYDIFMNDELYGKYHYMDHHDILKISGQSTQVQFLSQIDTNEFSYKYNSYIQFELDEQNMKNTVLNTQLVAYGIAKYMIQYSKEKAIKENFLQQNIYIFHGNEENKNLIQIRFYQQENKRYGSIMQNMIQFLINNINLNYQFQESQIDKIFIKKKDYMYINEKGEFIKDFEYVLIIFNFVKDFYFLADFKYVDQNRCQYNAIKDMQTYMSIVSIQRILYSLIQEASINIIGDEQLPQNVSIISQLMCHNSFVMSIYRSGIKNIAGQDTLYKTCFETQFQNLVNGALTENDGNTLNNYTNYFLNSQCKIGPNKSDILCIADKFQILNTRLKNVQIQEEVYRIFERNLSGMFTNFSYDL